MNARESVGHLFFFHRTTKPKQVIFTRRKNGFDSHILKLENQTKIESPKKTSIIQRTHSINRRLLNATPAFRYQSTLIKLDPNKHDVMSSVRDDLGVIDAKYRGAVIGYRHDSWICRYITIPNAS